LFFAGQAGKAEGPSNDVWTVPGEEALRDGWRAADRASDRDPMSYYHQLHDQDFLQAVLEDRPSLVTGLVTGEEGRRFVELMQAMYLSANRHAPVSFPL